MKDRYPDVKQDLYGAFVVRAIRLADGNGLLGIVIGDTWMSIKSFEAMRLRLLDGHAFDSFVHMRDVSNHPDIFGANAAFVLSMTGNRSRRAPFIRLTPLGSERKEHDLRRALAEQTADAGYHLASGNDFAAIPGTPIVYWLSEKVRAVFLDARPLRDVVQLREGINTGDNERFLRRWWEVGQRRTSYTRTQMGEPSESWVPHRKGGGFRRWAGNSEYVVNWGSSGEQIHEYHGLPLDTNGAPMRGKSGFFLPSLSWSRISSGDFSVRNYPGGYSYDSTSPSIFGREADLARTASLLNSSIVSLLLLAMSPTLDYRLTPLGNLPLPQTWNAYTSAQVQGAVGTAIADWNAAETSWEFEQNPLVAMV